MIWDRKEKTRKIIALIDYENISRRAVELGKVIDFAKLHQELTEMGEVIFAKVFVSVNYMYSLPNNLDDLGFEIVLCQKFIESDKLEDKVDINIIKTGMNFCQFEEITDIVIVSQDRHMINLVSEAKNHRKRLTIYGLDQISRALVSVVGVENTKLLSLI